MKVSIDGIHRIHGKDLAKIYIYTNINIMVSLREGKGDDMGTTKASQKAVNKYISKNYDRINLTMPKGRKEEVKAAAGRAGESLNEYINKAVTNRMETDEENRKKNV